MARLTHFVLLVLTMAPVAWVLGVAADRALSRDPELELGSTRGLLRGRIRLLRWCCRWAAVVCGVTIETTGSRQQIRQGLILANHLSYLDVVAIGAVLPCGFVAKREIASWPLIGAIARGLGCVFLDRDDLGNRVRTLYELRKRLSVHDMCVFPEGTTTRSRTPCGLRWRTGQSWAAHGGAAGVLAVAVSYRDHDSAVWTDDAAFLPHLLRILRQDSISVRLAFTPLSLPKQQYNAGDARGISRAACAAVTDLCSEIQSAQMDCSFAAKASL